MTNTPRRGLFAGRMHLPFVGLALFLGTFGGLLLAVTLPLAAAWRGIGVSWVEHAQVHGHLQAIGFVGLFIVGVSYRMLPAFAGRAMPFPRLVLPSFWALAAGILARAIGQPIADRDVGALLFVASGWLELAGLGLYAANVWRLAIPAARTGPAYWLFFVAGVGWFLVQGTLSALWITALVGEGGTVLPVARDAAVLFVQFFGVHLMFILGVGLRAFPTFFAVPPPGAGRVRAAFALIQVGIVAVVVVSVARAYGLGLPWAIETWLLEDMGYAALGAGLAWAASFTGWWRAPSRIRPGSRPAAYLLQPAMAWLVIAAGLLVAFALVRGAAGEGLRTPELDAIRHIVGVGVVLSTIAGMAQMILPEFASERLLGRQAAWRGLVFGVLLSSAAALRAGARLLEPWLPGTVVYWAMSLAGLCALVVVAVLGFYFVRGLRSFELVLEAASRPSEGRRGGG